MNLCSDLNYDFETPPDTMQGLCWGEGPAVDCWGSSVSLGDRKADPLLFFKEHCSVSVLSRGGLNHLAGIPFYFICRKLA